MEERKEGKRRFSVSRTRIVNEVVNVYAEDGAIAIEMAEELDDWEIFDGCVDAYEVRVAH